MKTMPEMAPEALATPMTRIWPEKSRSQELLSETSTVITSLASHGQGFLPLRDTVGVWIN